MKKSIFQLSLLLFLVGSSPVFSQGFTPPADGNACVYFVRVTAYGGVMPFEFFHERQIIGRIMGLSYMRYELPAGEALLWTSSENKVFVECDLAAGGTYLCLVNVKMGMWTARVDLEPIDEDNEDFQRVCDHVLDKGPMEVTQESLDESQQKLEERGFIEEMLEKYESKWKKDKKITKQMTADMAIPVDVLPKLE